MQYLQQHLHGLATQASQFTSMVHQHIHRTAEGEEKITALQVANESNNDNLEILDPIVQGKAALRNDKDSTIEHWAKQKNKAVSELLGDSTLTKEQVSQLRNELQWERAENQREREQQIKALAAIEEKVNHPSITRRISKPPG